LSQIDLAPQPEVHAQDGFSEIRQPEMQEPK
jgi:hypothetical protein